jgi:uncharacterized protein (DUF2237 family)
MLTLALLRVHPALSKGRRARLTLAYAVALAATGVRSLGHSAAFPPGQAPHETPQCHRDRSSQLLTRQLAMAPTHEAERADLNVLGEPLQCCCQSPPTGFYRDGFCRTGPTDTGRHTVCAIVTEAFLHFSRSQGNDLMTPAPRFGFPGLRPGDRWCLCVSRWKEALDAGCAPPVVLEACHQRALDVVTLEQLRDHAYERPE